MTTRPIAKGSIKASIEKQAIGSIAKNNIKASIVEQAMLSVANSVKVIIEQQAKIDRAPSTRAPSGPAAMSKASVVSWADMPTEGPSAVSWADMTTEGPRSDSDEGVGSDLETVSGTSRTSKSQTSSTKSTGRKRDRLQRHKKFLE